MKIQPSISVILRTKNESKYLERVLQRINEQRYGGAVEIVLVDSGSRDHTVSIGEEYGCKILTLKPEEFSFGRALNMGIEHARGEIIINLSGHSVPVSTDYFSLMVEPFKDPSVVATFGRDIPWHEACPSQARDILNHFPERDLDGSKFSNANGALRRDIWETIRFDEHVMASEDFLWARDILARGYKIIYIPKAEVFHSHTSSFIYIFRRYLKERVSLKLICNLPGVTLQDVLRHMSWQTLNDFKYARERGYGKKWFFHIPFYRLSQELGLYIGTKLADRRGTSG